MISALTKTVSIRASALAAKPLVAMPLVAVLFAAVAYSQPNVSRTATIPVEFAPDNSRDRWDHGHWIMYKRSVNPGDHPQIWAYNRDGHEVIHKTDLWFPDAYHVIVHSAAATNKPELFVSAEIWDSSGRGATALIRVAVPGVVTDVIRTDDFVGKSLAVAPSGEIWSFGLAQLKPSDEDPGRATIERYGPTGQTVARLLSRGSFNTKGAPALRNSLGVSRVVSSSTKIGVWSSRAKSWVEYDLSGNLIRRAIIEPPISDGTKKPYQLVELVMTDDSRVYAWMTAQPNGQGYGLFQMDLANARWLPVQEFSPGFGGLFGSEGNFIIRRNGCCTYGWVSPPDLTRPPVAQ